ncbi:MAG: TolC family protein [Bryobacteraceae bacterium]|jgi:outer membrane protein TolC
MRLELRVTALAVCAGALLYAQAPPESGPPPARATQLPLSGRGVIQAASPGAVPPSQAPGPSFALSLEEAIRRGISANLSMLASSASVRQAQGIANQERSNLLPTVTAGLLADDQQSDLAALGFSAIKLPSFDGISFNFPSVIGPYHYFDLRAGVSQALLDLARRRNWRASQVSEKAVRLGADDARDVVVAAVTAGYLDVLAAAARVDVARAQVAAAQAVTQQATDRHTSGLAAHIDVTRTQVELITNQQRLTSNQNDLAKRKIALARLIGLAPGQPFTLRDTMVFAPLADLTVEQAIERALAGRADLKAAEAQLHAAEAARGAVEAERFPTASVNADYGVIGTGPENSHGTFTLTGSLRVPLFQGGRVAADREQAEAVLSQRRAEYREIGSRIDAEVRSAFLDLESAATQVAAARGNRDLANETLEQARDRFAAGVADTVEVVQAQESVAAAEQDLVSALYAHNRAKADLARALGETDRNIKQFMGRP